MRGIWFVALICTTLTSAPHALPAGFYECDREPRSAGTLSASILEPEGLARVIAASPTL